jgi:hypothetical protein
VGITAVAKALSIGRVILPLNLFCIALSALAKWKKANPWVPRSYYQRKAGRDLKFLAKTGQTRDAMVFGESGHRSLPTETDRGVKLKRPSYYQNANLVVNILSFVDPKKPTGDQCMEFRLSRLH